MDWHSIYRNVFVDGVSREVRYHFWIGKHHHDYRANFHSYPLLLNVGLHSRTLDGWIKIILELLSPKSCMYCFIFLKSYQPGHVSFHPIMILWTMVLADNMVEILSWLIKVKSVPSFCSHIYVWKEVSLVMDWICSWLVVWDILC